MTSGYRTFLQAFGLGTALGLAPAIAQDDATDISTLIELAQNAAAQDVISLPGGQLADILTEADDAQRDRLIAELSAGDTDALLGTLALSGAAPELLAEMVSAIITLDPDAADRVIEIVQQNVAPAVLPDIAAGVFDVIEADHADMSRPVLDGHVLAALSFDTGLSERLIALGNSWDRPDAEELAHVLVDIIERDDAALASAIETALALEGGQMLELVAELRDEIPVAALPEATAAVPAAPAVPPAGVGGAGTSPGGTAASTPGRDAIFAAGGGSGPGLGAGPGFTPPPFRQIVSPTD